MARETPHCSKQSGPSIEAEGKGILDAKNRKRTEALGARASPPGTDGTRKRREERGRKGMYVHTRLRRRERVAGACS